MLLTGTAQEQCEALRKQVSGCASWFFWIAAMTSINAAMIHSGSETSFVIGLTVSMVVDTLTASMGPAAKFIALAFDVACIGSLVLLGFKGRRGQRWAFVVGLVLYGLDTLLSLAAPSIISIALHGWALFSIGMGLRLAGRLGAAEIEIGLPPFLGAPAMMPALASHAPRVGPASADVREPRGASSSTAPSPA